MCSAKQGPPSVLAASTAGGRQGGVPPPLVPGAAVRGYRSSVACCVPELADAILRSRCGRGPALSEVRRGDAPQACLSAAIAVGIFRFSLTCRHIL